MWFSPLPHQCISPKRGGESGHPCFIPVVLVITLDNPLGCLTYAHAFSYSAHVDQIMSEGILSAWNPCQKCSFGTILKALKKSTKQSRNQYFCSFVCSTEQHNVKMLLVSCEPKTSEAHHEWVVLRQTASPCLVFGHWAQQGGITWWWPRLSRLSNSNSYAVS